jgi:hypothetical protein
MVNKPSKKPAEPTEPVWPQHKVGKHCGYDLNEDGSIEVAPLYSDRMAKIQEDRAVIDELMKSAMRACEALMRPLVVAQNRLWDELCDDYGLDRREPWQLAYRTLTKVKKKDAV